MSSAIHACETCGHQVVGTLVANAEVLCDWPPAVGVIDVDKLVLARPQGADHPAAYLGQRLDAERGAMLFVEHDCQALSRLCPVFTAHGERQMAAAIAKARTSEQ